LDFGGDWDMNLKPGAMQSKGGKWFIETAFRGFRPRKITLDMQTILRMLIKYKDGTDNVLLNERISNWIDKLKSAKFDDEIREVVADIRYRTKFETSRYLVGLNEIAQYLDNMTWDIQTLKEPDPFNALTVSKAILKESQTVECEFLRNRMRWWSTMIEGSNFNAVKRDINSRAYLVGRNKQERTVLAIKGWVEKLITEIKEKNNGDNNRSGDS
jgi:hypothetical protein